MKIIRRGTLPTEKVYEGTCNHCDTVVEFQAKEAKLVSDQRDGDYYEIQCPVCGHTICV